MASGNSLDNGLAELVARVAELEQADPMRALTLVRPAVRSMVTLTGALVAECKALRAQLDLHRDAMHSLAVSVERDTREGACAR